MTAVRFSSRGPGVATMPDPRVAAAHAETLLDRLYYEARPLADRLTDAARAAEPRTEAGTAAGRALLTSWCDTVARGDAAAFARRLSWDGLTVEAVHRAATHALRPVHATMREAARPAWVTFLRDAYGETEAAFADAFSRSDGALADVCRPDDRLPFEELFAPVVATAAAHVRARSGAAYARLTRTAHAALERALLARLTHVGEQVLWAGYSAFRAVRGAAAAAPIFADRPGDDGRDLYLAFIDHHRCGALLGVFAEFPVLARLCATAGVLWIDATAELLARLTEDAPRLADAFNRGAPLGAVTGIATGLSDPHCGGRGVSILTWASNTRVVYKPRAVDLDAAFAALLRWLNAHGDGPALRPLTVLAREDYGWIEFAAATPCGTIEGVERFYERCGALLCLAYALNGRDFHFENLLAAGDHPVLLDLEMLLGHRFELVEDIPDATLAATIARRAWTESVMNVGMLPSLKPERNGYMFEVGALGSSITTEAIVVRCWHHLNTNQMRRGTRVVAPQSGANNLPRLDDEVVAPTPYIDRIVAGFEAMYHTLLVSRDELLAPDSVLDKMRPHLVRFILRNTSLYNALLDRCLHPQYLTSGIERSLQLDVLAKTFLALNECPTVWPAVAHEREALERMDIPLFAAPATSTALPLENGGVIDACFQSSAHGEMVQRIRSLTSGDCRRQAELIRGAFLASERRDLTAPIGTRMSSWARPIHDADELSPAVAIEEAHRIAAQLRDGSIDPATAAASWIAMNYVAAARRYVLAPMSYGVFDGYTGVALFFAAIHRAGGNREFGALARSAVRPLLSRMAEIERVVRLRRATEVGLGSGLSGAVYGLLSVARLLDDAELHEAARRIAALIDPCGDPRALRTDLHDVLSGSAGAVLAFLAIDDCDGDRGWRDRAAAFGERLLGARVEHRGTGLHVWAGPRGVIETGFAHGQAGIAYALARLSAATRRDDFCDAAREAVAYERIARASALGAGVDAEHRGGWARGATGIALARLGSLDVLNDRDTRAELEGALDTSRAALDQGVDSLCCGTAGRIDLLLDAAVTLSRPELRSSAARTAAFMVARAREFGAYDTGWPQQSAWQTGLFQGPAGVGYMLLRATMPEVLPSPLLWR